MAAESRVTARTAFSPNENPVRVPSGFDHSVGDSAESFTIFRCGYRIGRFLVGLALGLHFLQDAGAQRCGGELSLLG
jgi:hypothetical protein